jgi:hypothetical protein
VFNPTAGTGQIQDVEVTASSVLAELSVGEIQEAITVTEVTAFAPNTDNQLATDNALSYGSDDTV